MLILKLPDNVIYDTLNKDFSHSVNTNHPRTVPLGLVLDCEPFDFLTQVFGKPTGYIKTHILYNFSTSQYFVTSSLCAILS